MGAIMTLHNKENTMSFHVYIGPYAIVPHINVAPAITLHLCADGCASYGGMAKPSKPKFCEQCGSPIRYVQGQGPKELRRMTNGRLPDEFCDLMFSPEHLGQRNTDHSIWMPNQKDIGLNLRESNTDQAPRVLPTDEKEQCELFESRYEKLFAYIEAEHGIKISRGYGIVTYSL